MAVILALHFMSGPSKGKEFLLRPERDLTVGLSADDQWLIDDPRITRPAAELSTRGGTVTVKDLKSDKGTFVNSERVETATLKEGDRVRISGITCMLVSINRFSTAFLRLEKQIATPTPPVPAPVVAQQLTAPGKISGSIEEIPMVEILQFFSNSRKSGVLKIVSDKTGRVYLRDGSIYYATINDSAAVHPQKILFRILRWKKGNFELEAPDEEPVSPEITEPTSAILLEASQQSDEIADLSPNLPPEDAKLSLIIPLPGRLRDSAPEELDVLQLILQYGTVQGVLDNYPLPPRTDVASDLETYTHLLALIRRKMVRVNGAGGPAA